ncbi:MAG: sigma-70 family RNA polymerase sigma factor [Planctomycetota bacterium]|nr:sigma-70 family RNA polymerase sigma factor [Planctomycetota bacterium]
MLKGEAGGWREMIERYSPFLLAVARRTFQGYGVRPERSDCEDAIAEVWKNLVENDHKVVRDCLERNSLLPTLQVLAHHRSIDIMRRRRHTLSLSDAPPGVEPAAAPVPADLPIEDLAAALDQLTPRERTVVNLFFLQGRKYREIATLTGIPQNSIGPTLSRALTRLRQVIKI